MKKSPLRRVSKAMSRMLRLYYQLKDKYIEEHPKCEVCKFGDSYDVHHKKGRGIYLCVVKYFLAVCRMCHDKIELNRAWAREKKYLLDRIGVDTE